MYVLSRAHNNYYELLVLYIVIQLLHDVIILFLFSGVTSFALLQRMLNFVQGLQYYMSYEVLEPNYRHLESKLSRVVTIDEVLALHTGQQNTLSLPFICTCSLFLSFLSSVYLNIIFSFFLLSFQIFWIVV